MKKYIVGLGIMLGVVALGVGIWAIWDTREVEYGPNEIGAGMVSNRHHTPYSHRPKIGDMPAHTTYESWSIRIRCNDIDTTFRIGGSDAYKRTSLNQAVTVTYRKKYRVEYTEEFDQHVQKNVKREVSREFVGYDLVVFKVKS